MEKSIFLAMGDKLKLIVVNKELKMGEDICECCYVKLKDDTKTFIKVFNAVTDRLVTVGTSSEEEELLLYGPDTDYDIWIPKIFMGEIFNIFGKNVKIKSKHVLMTETTESDTYVPSPSIKEKDDRMTQKEFEKDINKFFSTLLRKMDRVENLIGKTKKVSFNKKPVIMIHMDFSFGEEKSYQETLDAIESGEDVMVTTFCTDFFNLDYLDKCDDVIVVKEKEGILSLRGLVGTTHFGKEIRLAHNVHKMLMSNSLDFKTYSL